MSEDTYSGRCKHGQMPNHCHLCDRERIAELEKQLEEVNAYADKLADGLPCLPKDIEILRQANTNLAVQLEEARNQIMEMQSRSDYDNGCYYASLEGQRRVDIVKARLEDSEARIQSQKENYDKYFARLVDGLAEADKRIKQMQNEYIEVLHDSTAKHEAELAEANKKIEELNDCDEKLRNENKNIAQECKRLSGEFLKISKYLARAVILLEQCEMASDIELGETKCPCCGNRNYRHDKNCRLRIFLDEMQAIEKDKK